MAGPSVFSAALQRATVAAAGVIDLRVIELVHRRVNQLAEQRPPLLTRAHVEELARVYGAADVLGRPSRFFPLPGPAELATTERRRHGGVRVFDLSFVSSYRPFHVGYSDEHASYPENLAGHARLFAGAWPALRPVIVCLHGWGGGPYWIEERAFQIELWLERGLDVLLFQLPFHGRRAPRPAAGQTGGSGALFPSPDLLRTNEAFGQAIYDLRALAAALRQRGAPAIGAIGMSLGGYVTALWASLDDDLAFAVPMIPAVVMADLMWRHGGDGPTRRRAERAGVGLDLVAEVLAVHGPLTRPVRLPDERLLIVAGRGDRITGPEHAEALWRHWGEPEIVWFPGGHLAQFGRTAALRAVRDRLTQLGLAGAARSTTWA